MNCRLLACGPRHRNTLIWPFSFCTLLSSNRVEGLSASQASQAPRRVPENTAAARKENLASAQHYAEAAISGHKATSGLAERVCGDLPGNWGSWPQVRPQACQARVPPQRDYRSNDKMLNSKAACTAQEVGSPACMGMHCLHSALLCGTTHRRPGSLSQRSRPQQQQNAAHHRSSRHGAVCRAASEDDEAPAFFTSSQEEEPAPTAYRTLEALSQKLDTIMDTNTLQTALTAALRAEQYSLAARVRDRIKEVRAHAAGLAVLCVC